MANEIFLDWLSISQLHTERDELLPVHTGGFRVDYDALGNARYERVRAAPLKGSYETSVLLKSDGRHVSLSGNIGRYGRKDNLFNLGWSETLAKASRMVLSKGLPSFSNPPTRSTAFEPEGFGARISHMDITSNFATGSESQARALIRWLASRSVSRMKKGRAGDESVWFSNSRHILKAYIKHIEMANHGMSKDDPIYQWARDQGVVRVEIGLRRRMLSDAGLKNIETITQDKIEKIFLQETEIFRKVDRSDEPDILDAIPSKSRIYAAAWFNGDDLINLVSRATLFRHAKVLREYGIDIMEPRNVEKFPVKVQLIELKPLSPPDWYKFDDDQPLLKVVGQ